MENREELDEMLMNEELTERIGFGRRLGAYLGFADKVELSNI